MIFSRRVQENAGWHDLAWRRAVIRWAALAAVLHFAAAIFSAGFYHADEHFQILEFIHARRGLSPLADLPIEYARQIRPWLQPIFYGFWLRALEIVGVTDPFVGAAFCRLVSALVGWLSLVGLMLCAWRGIAARSARGLMLVASALIWYMPAFHARHSSENLSGSVFFLGLSALLLGAEWKGEGFRRLREIPVGLSVVGGFVLGLSFDLRYQVGFMVLGAGLWFWLVARASFRALLAMALGVAAAVALGTCLDRWGYGEWTFAPWNYLNFNLVQHHVQDTDTNPLWDFFRRAATETWPPLGILALISFVIAWVRRPWHVLTWSLVPLFLVHHAIGHKELRFLFPLAHAGPFLLALALERRAPWPVIARFFGGLVLAIDLIALFAQSLLPAWMPIRLYSFLYHFEPQPLRLGVVGEGPYLILGNPLHFYRPPGFNQASVPDFSALGRWVEQEERAHPGQGTLVLRNGFALPAEMGEVARSCHARFRTLPLALDRPELGHALSNVKNWTVFECRANL